MARSRFVGDVGLTVRMTTVMFLLGALFVALVVGLAFGVGGPLGLLIGIAGIGLIGRWPSSTAYSNAL